MDPSQPGVWLHHCILRHSANCEHIVTISEFVVLTERSLKRPQIKTRVYIAVEAELIFKDVESALSNAYILANLGSQAEYTSIQGALCCSALSKAYILTSLGS